MTARAALRCLRTHWAIQFKLITMLKTYLFAALCIPLILATIGFYLAKSGPADRPVLALALGAGFMGMWSTTLHGSGAAITRQRHAGTLETLVAAPMPTVLVLAPITVAAATMGLYSIVATLGWGVLLFDLPLRLADPGAFAVALLATVLSVGLLGLLLSVAFVLYPTAQGLTNMLQYPVWLLSGLFVPVAALPEAAQTVSVLLAPTWGVQAVHAAAAGSGAVWRPVLLCGLLAAAYTLAAAGLLRHVEDRARRTATLALT